MFATIGRTRSRKDKMEVWFRDFRLFVSKKTRSVRFCPLEFRFPLVKEEGTKDEFWTLTQESFFRSYHDRGTSLADERRLRWPELERAVGITIRPLFEWFSSFVNLFEHG